MLIIVEGCGAWAMEYLKALEKYREEHKGKVRAIFTFDSTFGLNTSTFHMPVDKYLEYVTRTLARVEEIKLATFAVIDTRDTLHRLAGRMYEGRRNLPERPDAVFIASPDSTHCDVAAYWIRRAPLVFVEKPFDVDSSRIERLCGPLRQQGVTQVLAIDHYLVRLENLVRASDVIKQRLANIVSFEFAMTEQNSGDVSELTKARALSLQQGLIFDMGSHALPVLLPFIDTRQPVDILKVHAGVCSQLKNHFFLGGETYSEANVRLTVHRDFGGGLAEGTITIGKLIGDQPQKHLILRDGQGNEVIIELSGDFRVLFRDKQGNEEPLYQLDKNWAHLIVRKLLDGDQLPETVTRFQPEGALKIIRFLEEWRKLSKAGALDGRPLAQYEPGAKADDLRMDRAFRTYLKLEEFQAYA